MADQESNQFIVAAIRGLSNDPKSIPCKFLYDARGSALFEQICSVGDYYVTRADLALHRRHMAEISWRIGPGAHVIELGSGASTKTRMLLSSLDAPRAYTAIEISRAALEQSVTELRQEFPCLSIFSRHADYTAPLAPPAKLAPKARAHVVYFPGSTISNFTPADAERFLHQLHTLTREDGAVLVGVDLEKSPDVLIRAYDDSEHATASFNLNLLRRMQAELNASVELDAFRHEARYNADESCIEMHLCAKRDTTISFAGRGFTLRAGETIHTENSYKYSISSFAALAARAGFRSKRVWLDPDELYSTHWLVPIHA